MGISFAVLQILMIFYEVDKRSRESRDFNIDSIKSAGYDLLLSPHRSFRQHSWDIAVELEKESDFALLTAHFSTHGELSIVPEFRR